MCHIGVVTLWMTSFRRAISRACPSAVQPPKEPSPGRNNEDTKKDWVAWGVKAAATQC